jgi:hypothetical protein
MTSTVTNFSNLINENFPVKGKLNDLKGFRNNFDKIKTSIEIVDGEINNIKSSGVYLNNTNDFNYFGTITNAVIDNCEIFLKSYP